MKPQKTDAFRRATGPKNKALNYSALESFSIPELDEVREQLTRDISAMIDQIRGYDPAEAPSEDWLDKVCIALQHKVRDHAFVLSRIQQERAAREAVGTPEHVENWVKAAKDVCDEKTLRRIREEAHGTELAAETAEPSVPEPSEPHEWNGDQQPDPNEGTRFTHE